MCYSHMRIIGHERENNARTLDLFERFAEVKVPLTLLDIEWPNSNDVDPQAWLADVLARLPDHPANKVADLLPWSWNASHQPKAAAAA
jgi:hypothetical protein